MANVDSKTSTLFSIWVDDVSTAYDVLENDIMKQIKAMKAMKMGEQEIYDKLFASLNDGMDMFQTFKGTIGRSNDTLVNMISQVESNETIKEVSDLWIWELDPTAEKHCETCLTYGGQIKTFDEWESLGLPGYGATDCGKYCRCTLLPTK